ncbi:CU044_5270 family protein [Nocardioides agariphilus]|jgi:hypothetical protein|uniref:CU044_5270 family protein n=1 Tax=Nocardioides agariphilus TaxID=433664 RepID=A0A930VPK6_9ACTN|nr:CU044_5270 family protein [Nocardioides agariphilus]MBF4768560.1 CU044_5270 family protein [Nocardioides agariphilus]
MDELTLLREFRDTAPTAVPQEVRERSLGPSARRTARRRPAMRVAVASALLVTGGGLGAVVLEPSAPSAAAVLGRAAAVVSAQPDLTPRTNQWIYVRALLLDAATGKPGTHPGESWSRFDGARSGSRMPDGSVLVQDLESWPLGTPQEWYQALAHLPARPADVLAYLRSDPLYTSRAESAAGRDFDEVVEALSAETYIPPDAQASLYRALATIPGVGVDEDPARDLVGRPALSITYAGQTSLGRAGDRWELLLDPTTYAVLGTRGTAGSDIDLGDVVVKQGHVWYAVAILDHRLVDSAGDTD